jgi:acetoin utilization deacetylase AcuC-like enzyme
MLTVYSEDHRLHDSKYEIYGGIMVPPHEMPRRMDMVMGRLKSENFGEIIEPEDFGMDAIRKIHDAGYLTFLETIWDEWAAIDGYQGEIIPTVWPSRRVNNVSRIPDFPEGKAGYYALSSETSINSGTWKASYTSAQVALTAYKIVADGARSAFGLCRPPGHHAAADMYGGYCFLNNAAIVAQKFLDDGAKKVAVLDPDFHHGNGTQSIFYDRDDVFYASLHGDPNDMFPHFLGWAEETGEGAGEGCNANYPMPPGTGFDVWFKAFEDACEKIAAFGAEAIVISHGVDTYENDPISFFKLKHPDYITYGKRIADMGLPTVFLMEGGYAVEEIGINAVNVLQGFESA